MKESASISGKEIENISLNFTELRNKGLEYIQELSGNVWTDYNLHDPGVTILDQLCYALTDIGYRTSLPVKDLLTPKKETPIDGLKNAFFAPSQILSSHPISIKDIRKLIIDHFEEIQNVWVTKTENIGFEEQISGLYEVEILPRLNFHRPLTNDPTSQKEFENTVKKFLNGNRNLGEYFTKVRLLNPQVINIHFDIYLNDQVDVEATIANLILKLFEFIYSPVQHNSFNEMVEAGYSLAEIFSGPRLENGFIKNNSLKERTKTIYIDELQKLFSKVNGISKCTVELIKSKSRSHTKSVIADEDSFFHLLNEDNFETTIDRFENIYSNLKVYVNRKIIPGFNKQKVNILFVEEWSKKYRRYQIATSKAEDFQKMLNGVYREPSEYYSIQRHFPLIYGIGEVGLSSNEPEERKAKALQLKAYLMLFEQHLANHLAQLGNLNEFFNIDFNPITANEKGKTYFAQWMNSVPEIEKLTKTNLDKIHSLLETEETFYERKNRIYNHLLARFGEDLNETPWKVALRLNLINDKKFNSTLLAQKSELLIKLKDLSYNRAKGESLKILNPETEKQEVQREASGLEQLISVKTGIPVRSIKLQSPAFFRSEPQPHELKEEKQKNKKKFASHYRELQTKEIKNHSDSIEITDNQEISFGKIGIRTLFKETLNYKNYRLSVAESPEEKIHVIFQKEPNKWVSLFECDDETIAIKNIFGIINYFIKQNSLAEGFHLVDHILLLDMKEGSRYGYRFIDEYGTPLFRTIEDDSWSENEEERATKLKAFFKRGKVQNSYPIVNDQWTIKDINGRILASCDPAIRIDNPKLNDPEDLFKQTKNIIRLFDWTQKTDGRFIFEELEKIRLVGISSENDKEVYGQRRLVFQRKLSSGEIIDEDFFNLNISVLLPDWPARFQDERFKDYLTELIRERLPAHIANEILWVDAKNMEDFEEKYNRWEKLKAASEDSEKPSEELKAAAFAIYQKINDLKKMK